MIESSSNIPGSEAGYIIATTSRGLMKDNDHDHNDDHQSNQNDDEDRMHDDGTTQRGHDDEYDN